MSTKSIKIAFNFATVAAKTEKQKPKFKEKTQNLRKPLKTQGKNLIFRHFQNPVM